ncbi:hypothetical protein MNEG_12249 [Monoraphidium neglectum]|uniref:Uncharacterized protein n=1 Tax=Monoraphidium neglectum TaxID=145388 RepID=A0A0D2J7G2_9CHLO|nr:hypothetical protein MNEG_12249 [Monoraphidium neglectum]KIY95712.1 hypothetical protein MNEG_12249 [Monoraphidium neglectum]|eukprot:XP_013894732.1 hypothetical protein MNEG_12249 [Monoraphidium neglectum]
MTHAWAAACDGAALPVRPEGDPLELARRALDAWGGILAPAPVAAAAAPAAPAARAAFTAVAVMVGDAAVLEAPVSPVLVSPEQAVRA